MRPTRAACGAFVLALTIPVSPAFASAKSDAEDIRDKPRDKVERKLGDRGYSLVSENRHDGSQTWWNRQADDCLEVYLSHDRVSRAEPKERKHCENAAQQNRSHQGAPVAQGASGMIGMRANNLDAEMKNRGFRSTGGYQDGDTAHSTWWNKSTRECLAVATRNGRVDELKIIAEGNCL
jgi:hypothetical protein